MSEEKNNPQPNNNYFANRKLPLSLYTFITRPGENVQVLVPQEIQMIVAFTQDEAMIALAQKFPTGAPFTVDFKGVLPMSTVMGMLNKVVEQNAQANAGQLPLKAEPEIVTRTKRDYYKEIVEGMIKDASAFTNNEQEKNILLVSLHKMLSLVS